MTLPCLIFKDKSLAPAPPDQDAEVLRKKWLDLGDVALRTQTKPEKQPASPDSDSEDSDGAS